MRRPTPAPSLWTALLSLALLVPALAYGQSADAGSASADAAAKGPSIPTPPTDEAILFDPSVPEDFDPTRMERCFEEFSTDVRANYRIYVFSTAEGTRLDDLPSINDFADRAHQTFTGANWYAGKRGLLLLLNLGAGDTGVETGPRWSMTGFDGFRQSPVKLAYDTPAEKICHLADEVDRALAKRLRTGIYGSLDDYRARVRLIERDVDTITERSKRLEERASALAPSSSMLVTWVRGKTPLGAERLEKLRQDLFKLRQSLKERVRQHPETVREEIRQLDNRAMELEERVQEAERGLGKFEAARRALDKATSRSEQLQKDYELERQSRWLWVDSIEISDRFEACESRRRVAKRDLDAGQPVGREVVYPYDRCLDRIEERIETPSTLDYLVTRFLPALLAILAFMGLIWGLYHVVRERQELQNEFDGLLDDWQNALDFARMQLQPLRKAHPDAFERSRQIVERDKELTVQEDELRGLVLAAAVDLTLRQRLEQALEAREDAGMFSLEDLQKAVDLLARTPITIEGREVTPEEALDEVEELAQQAADEHGVGRL